MITIELEKVKELTDGTEIWSWAQLFKAETEEGARAVLPHSY
jgi:hypothetical protein